MKIKCARTSLRSPWQNGVAERWVESCPRDLLDHIVALDERHLKRFLSEYGRYYYGAARISDSGKAHPTAEFVSTRRVVCFLTGDSAGCTIVTIGRPDSDCLFAHPSIYTHGMHTSLPTQGRLRSRKAILGRVQTLHAVAQEESCYFWRG